MQLYILNVCTCTSQYMYITVPVQKKRCFTYHSAQYCLVYQKCDKMEQYKHACQIERECANTVKWQSPQASPFTLSMACHLPPTLSSSWPKLVFRPTSLQLLYAWHGISGKQHETIRNETHKMKQAQNSNKWARFYKWNGKVLELLFYAYCMCIDNVHVTDVHYTLKKEHFHFMSFSKQLLWSLLPFLTVMLFICEPISIVL